MRARRLLMSVLTISSVALLINAKSLAAESQKITSNAAQPSAIFSVQEKQLIEQYFKDQQAQQALYKQYHGEPKSHTPPAAACPSSFKKEAVAPLDVMAEAQLLPAALQAQLPEREGYLNVIRGRCVFRILDANRTVIDWISVN